MRCKLWVVLFLIGTAGAALFAQDAPILALSWMATLEDGGLYTLDSLTATLFWKIVGFDMDATVAADTDGVQSLTFGAKRDLGFAKLSSKLEFDASPPAFKAFQVGLTGAASGVELGYLVYLAAVQTASYQRISAKYASDVLSLQAAANFSLIPIEFQELVVSAKGKACPTCTLGAFASLLFTKEGFQYFDAGVEEVDLPCCEAFKLLMTVKVTFTPDSKTVVPTLKIKLAPLCADFTPSIALIPGDPGDGALSIAGVEVTGFTCKITFANSIVGTFTTSFKQDSEFFETWSLTGPIPSCCAPPGKWLIALDFRTVQVPPTLFGWGRLTLAVEVPVLKQATILLKLTIRPSSPVWALSFGLKSLW